MRVSQLEIMSDKIDTNDTDAMILELCKIFNADKGENIITLDMSPIYGYASSFLIVTALSSVHLKKLTNDAMGFLKEQKIFMKIVPTQTDYESGWVVLDCGGILVHIFLKEVRDLYNLEELWVKAPQTSFTG